MNWFQTFNSAYSTHSVVIFLQNTSMVNQELSGKKDYRVFAIKISIFIGYMGILNGEINMNSLRDYG